MAEHLASIFGTEKDRVNCPFYFKIGACRHGDRCSRLHTKPSISPTILLSNMYQRPDMITPGVDAQGNPIDPRKIQQHFEAFYEDLFEELSKYGQIESLNICDNLADHMFPSISNFARPIIVDFSPVTDFREATCRQELRRQLFGRSKRRRSHSRSRSPNRRRNSHDERPHGSCDHSRRYNDRDNYHESRSRRRRSTSPGHRRGRSRSPGGKRNHSPIREGSEERRAKIEQWNREREQQENANNFEKDAANNNNENGSNEYLQNDDKNYQQQE
ncbi:Splicing factor U2af small subunit B [Gossypium australe]|uniref:Splicing factor U2af small subunit B n=1 Tax=Gossypium australe TaxID=47621 RepID=A0A5B6UDY7_9ROSI|nr:Splicing factor U2af small subunit B [Gossypium australe]